jgi:GNAT superfamily N-acetyltransferase
VNISIIPFDKSKHLREGFDCGVPELNQYLLKQASQDVRNHYTEMFVTLDPETNRILGYYTLSRDIVPFQNIPQEQSKNLPKYSKVPATLLGRLAVDKSMQGKGLGSDLMADAIIRSLGFPNWAVMVVDAKDDAACAFYEKFKFAPLLDKSLHLYARRLDLERFITQTRDHSPLRQEIEEVKIAVPSKIKEDWITVASAKGQTLEEFITNLTNDATGKFFAECNAAKNAVRREQEDKNKQSTPLPLLERLKNQGR